MQTPASADIIIMETSGIYIIGDCYIKYYPIQYSKYTRNLKMG